MAGNYGYTPGVACTHFMGALGLKKDPAFQIMGKYVLIADVASGQRTGKEEGSSNFNK